MFQISEAIRSARTLDGAVLLDIHQNRILATNIVGANIFELMQRGCDQRQIAEEISRRFQIPIETAAGDVAEFAQSLVKCGVLVETKPTRTP